MVVSGATFGWQPVTSSVLQDSVRGMGWKPLQISPHSQWAGNQLRMFLVNILCFNTYSENFYMPRLLPQWSPWDHVPQPVLQPNGCRRSVLCSQSESRAELKHPTMWDILLTVGALFYFVSLRTLRCETMFLF